MARRPRIRNLQNIKDTFRERVNKNTDITHWNFDSTARILGDSLSAEVEFMNRESLRAHESMQLATATGENLDAIGSLYGLERLQPSFAKIKYEHRNLYFYASGFGTFGGINGGLDIVLSAGTLVASRPAMATAVSAATFRITKNYTLSAGSRVAYCEAVSTSMGPHMNVGTATLNYHDYVDYVDNTNGSLLCTNRYPVLTGRAEEDDDQYRFRISQRYGSIVGNNIANIRLLGLEISGVLDVRVIPGYFGIGTAAVAVFGGDSLTSLELSERMQDRLNSIQGPGLKLVAVPGVQVFLDLEVRVLLRESVSAEVEFTMRQAIADRIWDSMRSDVVTRYVDLNNIASNILNDDLVVSLVSNSHSVENFEGAYIRKVNTGEAALVERKKLVSPTLALDDLEYITLGEVVISFETKI